MNPSLLLSRYGLVVAGYGLAALFGWLYVGAKGDLAAEREACNTRIVESARRAAEAVSVAKAENYEKQIAELQEIADREAAARTRAEAVAEEARKRPERVRTVIREVASENECIDTVVPDAVLDGLRRQDSDPGARDRRDSDDQDSWNSFGLDDF